ncbi:6-hydroxymethylpterin diphosphokinase MptE-like protein [Sporosarcina psychrophila]|uniref:6-hydroxymethylpterin diphosphokinase MptE-like domain-containing protein n=1 Tax=Sporosarcina psychrophila TaxID=1476 RepID=A0ABV2K346_SPOPS
MLSNKLKQLVAKYYFLKKIIMFIRKIQLKSIAILFEFQASCREKGIIGKSYRPLKSIHNIHKGKRCFIIATGPSLSLSDVEKLENEYTISMNSMCLALDKTNWRPTYYGIQDENVYEKIESVLKSANLPNVLISDNIAKRFSINSSWIQYPLNIAYHSYEQGYEQRYFAKFSDNCYRAVYDGYSVTYSLIQLAVYMGFNEIYLLGADTNYSKDKTKQHFVESGHFDPLYKTAGERMIIAYKVAKEYADSHGINIYNATRGGMLEVFPRVDLDEVLGLKERQ